MRCDIRLGLIPDSFAKKGSAQCIDVGGSERVTRARYVATPQAARGGSGVAFACRQAGWVGGPPVICLPGSKWVGGPPRFAGRGWKFGAVPEPKPLDGAACAHCVVHGRTGFALAAFRVGDAEIGVGWFEGEPPHWSAVERAVCGLGALPQLVSWSIDGSRCRSREPLMPGGFPGKTRDPATSSLRAGRVLSLSGV
jgi:hypothetical protein